MTNNNRIGDTGITGQFFIILLFYASGEAISFLLKKAGLTFPGSVAGMILLAVFLINGWIKLKQVERTANFLLKNLGLFFIPPGVRIMRYFNIITGEFLPIAASILISTVLVLLITGLCAEKTEKTE